MKLNNPSAQIVQNTIKKSCEWLSKLKNNARKQMPISYQGLSMIAAYIWLVGMVDWYVQRHFMHKSTELFMQWTPGFRPDGATYNVPFIVYIIAVGAIMGAVCTYFFLQYVPPANRFISRLIEHHWGKLFGLSIPLCMFCPFDLATTCFAITFLCFAGRIILEGIPACDKRAPSSARLVLNFVFFAAVLVFSCFKGYQALFPAILTNDYMEVADRIVIPGTDIPINRDEAIRCLMQQQYNNARNVLDGIDAFDRLTQMQDDHLEEIRPKDSKSISDRQRSTYHSSRWSFLEMPKEVRNLIIQKPCEQQFTQQQADAIDAVLAQTGAWQSLAGRVLYHQSYVYVPVAHFLEHGIFSPIPVLYGYGNTLFHALLMKGKAITLTNYFNTVPFALLGGIVVLVLCIAYVTGSLWGGLAAIAAALISLFTVGYENMHLAPGFTPLRYAGLAMQIASIFYMFRNQGTLRIAAFLGALAFSLLWNKEFAVLGFAGQAIGLMLPSIRLSIAARATTGVAMVAVAGIIFYMLGKLSTGFLETIQVGIFTVATPPPSMDVFRATCVGVLFGVLLFSAASMRFENGERMARFAVIPILALLMIKFIYNASPVHFWYAMAFVWPVAMIFLDWKGEAATPYFKRFSKLQRWYASQFALTVLVMMCALGAMHFERGSVDNRKIMVDLFEKNTWSGLGESFQVTTPSEPIETRMKAVQQMLGDQDTALFLSPFDHLMSFYGNPKTYCGHFEYLTNLVTYRDINATIECAHKDPNILVVYDEALKDKCDTVRAGYIDARSCVMKKRMMQSMQFIIDALMPDLVLVKKVGPLSFYRHASAAGSKP